METEEQNIANNAFAVTLSEIRNGDCLNEVSNEMGRLIQAVRLTGRAGKITLKMKVEPASRGDVTRIFIEDQISIDIPKPQRAKALFFTTEEGGLQRKDPNQLEMDLKVISSKPSQELKEIPQKIAVNAK